MEHLRVQTYKIVDVNADFLTRGWNSWIKNDQHVTSVLNRDTGFLGLITGKETNHACSSLIPSSEQPVQTKHTKAKLKQIQVSLSSLPTPTHPAVDSELETTRKVELDPSVPSHSPVLSFPHSDFCSSPKEVLALGNPASIKALPNMWCVYSSQARGTSLSNDWQQLENEMGPKWAEIMTGSLSSQTASKLLRAPPAPSEWKCHKVINREPLSMPRAGFQ